MVKNFKLLLLIVCAALCSCAQNSGEATNGASSDSSEILHENTIELDISAEDEILDIQYLALDMLADCCDEEADKSSSGYIMIDASGDSTYIYRIGYDDTNLDSDLFEETLYIIERYEAESSESSLADFINGEEQGDLSVISAVRNTINPADYHIMDAWAQKAEEEGKFVSIDDFNKMVSAGGEKLLCVIKGDLSMAMGGYGFEDSIAPQAVMSDGDNGIVSFIRRFYDERGTSVQHFGRE